MTAAASWLLCATLQPNQQLWHFALAMGLGTPEPVIFNKLAYDLLMVCKPQPPLQPCVPSCSAVLQHLISQAGWNRCNLLSCLAAVLTEGHQTSKPTPVFTRLEGDFVTAPPAAAP